MALYSDKVMDHFMNPRNVGKLDNPSGVGQVGNARCGDIMKIFLKVENGVIEDVKFQTFGCGAAIATRIPMIPTTIISSIRVKPFSLSLRIAVFIKTPFLSNTVAKR